jgi:calpain-5
MAVAVYNKYDLIENIFASRPEDFVKHGVYTCRFYVDGEWVEVISDTNIPCLRNNRNGDVLPMYGRSNLINEMWIPLVEKAFAKAVGSYEAITNMKVQKALLHLTGGSVQQSNIRDEVIRNDMLGDHHSWDQFKRRLNSDCIVLLQPEDRKAQEIVSPEDGDENGNDSPEKSQDQHFIPNKLYSVIACRDVGGYELVLMHNPWFHPNYTWTGEWSDVSNDWDLYPELLVELERDSSIPWKRKQPNGYFWITFRQLVRYFNKMVCCQLFPNEKFNFYCVRGECRQRHAGGPLSTIRDKETVLKEAAASRMNALQKVRLFLDFFIRVFTSF